MKPRYSFVLLAEEVTKPFRRNDAKGHPHQGLGLSYRHSARPRPTITKKNQGVARFWFIAWLAVSFVLDAIDTPRRRSDQFHIWSLA